MNERIEDQFFFFKIFKIGADFKSQHERDMRELLRDVQPEDLLKLKFGLIREFIGRLKEAIERKSGA